MICARKKLPALALYCRAGFERDCAEEISRRAGALGLPGKAEFQGGSALVCFAPENGSAATLCREIDFQRLVFCRQWLVATETMETNEREIADRMAEAFWRDGAGFCGVLVDFPDSPSGRQLSQRARILQKVLEERLFANRQPQVRGGRLARVCLLEDGKLLVGWAPAGNSSPWPGGVPRLRLPPGSPSRSALKLEEALFVLLGEKERRRYLKAGLRAVDLGAAPGGWSHALSLRGLLVTAVDRARLAPQVAQNDLVEHVRADGFTYRPPRPVEWLFCDIIDKPARVRARVADWLGRGWARRAIFNLKLPMKRRFEQVELELSRLRRVLFSRGRLELRCRHLYHDRLEVTCYAAASG